MLGIIIAILDSGVMTRVNANSMVVIPIDRWTAKITSVVVPDTRKTLQAYALVVSTLKNSANGHVVKLVMSKAQR